MIRKLFFAAAVTMAALIFCACAYADASLFVFDVLFVPVEDVGRLLGFSSSRNGEELFLQRGNIQLRLVDNSAAAWHGFSIVPLYSAPFNQDGKTWLDSSSAAALFQRILGAGQSNRLKITKSSGYTVTANKAQSEIDFGDFETPTPEPAPAVAKLPEPVIKLPEAKTAAKPVQQVQPVQPVGAQLAEIKLEEMKPKTSNSSSNAKAQPKLETFRLGESKGDKTENYSGVIHGIRWTSHEGSQKKIRAVVLVDDYAEPTVFMNHKQLHALFSSSLETPERLASPFGNITLEIKKNARGVDLVFDLDKLSKAEKIVLTNPKRIVFDFFLPSNVAITNSAKTQVQQATQPKTVIPATPAPVIAQNKEKEKEEEQPAKTLILIPTTPRPTPSSTPTQSRNNIKISSGGRKTIVKKMLI